MSAETVVLKRDGIIWSSPHPPVHFVRAESVCALLREWLEAWRFGGWEGGPDAADLFRRTEQSIDALEKPMETS